MPLSSRAEKRKGASSVSAKRARKSAPRTSPPGVSEEQADFDPDDLPMTCEMIQRLRPFDEKEKAVWRKALGRPLSESPKQAVSIRLDGDVIAHFKQAGAGWQSRINAALRKQAKLGRK